MSAVGFLGAFVMTTLYTCTCICITGVLWDSGSVLPSTLFFGRMDEQMIWMILV